MEYVYYFIDLVYFISMNPDESRPYFVETLTVEEMLTRSGSSNRYQIRIFTLFFLVWLFSAFIQMGFPIIFRPAILQCPEGVQCTKQNLCAQEVRILSPEIHSIAYSFNLICEKQSLINTSLNAFLIGGFLGSLYYGEVIERKGRRHGTIQSLLMMVVGLILSVISGNVTLFSIGVFLFSAGFRGFYNASLLVLSEVMDELSRASTPMVLSIGWAFGQIFVAILGIWIVNWRVIFALTLIPLAALLYFCFKEVKESPRFLVIKNEFKQAKEIISEISIINGKTYVDCNLRQQIDHLQKFQGRRNLLNNSVQIDSKVKHHSYASLLKFTSIRIRVYIVGGIWSIVSLSYFMSANSLVNPSRGYVFNIALAGTVEVIAYFISLLTSLDLSRLFVIKRFVIVAGLVHLCYFFIGPLNQYSGFSVLIVMTFDIAIRMLMSFGNTFLAIYTVELFPTEIRHYTLGILGFITKLMYMLSFWFAEFWSTRHIHPNFIIGAFFIASYFWTSKLRETKQQHFKDSLSENNDGNLMNVTTINIF